MLGVYNVYTRGEGSPYKLFVEARLKGVPFSG